MRPSLLADQAAPGQESVCGVTTQLFTRTSSDSVSWEAVSCAGPSKATNTNTNTKSNFLSSSSDPALLSHVLSSVQVPPRQQQLVRVYFRTGRGFSCSATELMQNPRSGLRPSLLVIKGPHKAERHLCISRQNRENGQKYIKAGWLDSWLAYKLGSHERGLFSSR